MLYIIAGFIFGCLIPYLARRLGKLMPGTMGYILLKIFIPQHCMPWSKLKNDFEYMQLFKSYMMRSLGWGIFTAAATYLFAVNFDPYYTDFFHSFCQIFADCSVAVGRNCADLSDFAGRLNSLRA